AAWLLTRAKPSWKQVLDLFTGVLVALAIVVLIAVLLGDGPIIPRGFALTRFFRDDVWSLNSRLPLWEAGVAYSVSSWNAFLRGGGIGYSNIVVSSANPRHDSIHNMYLQILVDYGVVGLALFLTLHWS